MKDLAIVGRGGYIAPRHMQAIKDAGNDAVAALDPGDSVSIIDSYFPNARFFVGLESFDRHVEKLRRHGGGKRVDYVAFCPPICLRVLSMRAVKPVTTDALDAASAETARIVHHGGQQRSVVSAGRSLSIASKVSAGARNLTVTSAGELRTATALLSRTAS